MNQKKWKNKNFLEALKNSLAGIKHSFKYENNLKIQLVFAVIVIISAIILKFEYIKLSILFITIGFVIFAELINTAIELALDLYTEEYNENVKVIKDISSGAVLVASIVSVFVGISLFLPEIINILI